MLSFYVSSTYILFKLADMILKGEVADVPFDEYGGCHLRMEVVQKVIKLTDL